MKTVLTKGDRVAFSAKVIRACRHAPDVASFVGTVSYVDSSGKTCDVLHLGGVKSIPCANLVRVCDDGLVMDLRG